MEFCKRAGEITKQVRDAIEAFDSKEKEEDCLEECSQLLRYIHGGSTAQEALIADKKGKCEQLGIRFEATRSARCLTRQSCRKSI